VDDFVEQMEQCTREYNDLDMMIAPWINIVNSNSKTSLGRTTGAIMSSNVE